MSKLINNIYYIFKDNDKIYNKIILMIFIIAVCYKSLKIINEFHANFLYKIYYFVLFIK